MAQVDVGTKLTLDDEASDSLKHIQRGFEDVDTSIDASAHTLQTFAATFAGTFSALSLGPLLGELQEGTASLIGIGAAAFDVEQGIAGMLAGMTGSEWKISRAYAEDLNDEFLDLSINIGQAKDDIIAGHSALTTFLGGTSRAMMIASDNMENLTTIANVQGLTVQELGGQFGKMAAGFVSMESPVFNLLKSTGIFADDITKVNAEWQKLTQEERVNRLEGAFSSIATNLKDAPPTLNDMLSSVSAIGTEFMETFGKSAMGGFMQSFDELRGDLRNSRGDMKDLARDFGKDVGEFVSQTIDAMRVAFVYIQNHGDEIRDAVKDGFRYARDTISWIIEHKTELMAIGTAFALSKTGIGGAAMGAAAGIGAGALGSAAGALGERTMSQSAGMKQLAATHTMSGKFAASMGKFSSSGGMAVQTGARLGGMLTTLIGAIAAGGPVVWGLTAAMGALAVGAVALNNKLNEAEEERQKVIKTSLGSYEQITQTVGRLSEKQLKSLDRMRAKAERAGADSGERTTERFEGFDEARKELLRQYVTPMEEAKRSLERVGGMVAAEGENVSQELFNKFLVGEKTIVAGMSTMFNRAHEAHNDGVTKYMLSTINGSEQLRKSFLMASEMTAEGFGHLAGMAETMGEDFKTFTEQLRGRQKQAMAAASPMTKSQVNFNGGQVFKIHQNFREQDPDRVVVAFQKKVTQAAVSRVQPTTGTPFGT